MKKLLIILGFLCLSNLLNAQIPTGSLTAYWPFNSTLLANDSTANGNNGLVSGATLTTDRFGNCNQAYKFNGLNNFILVPNSPTINMNGTDFSIALWIKTYAGDTNSTPLAKNPYGSVSGYLFWANCGNPGYCTTPKHASFYASAGYQQDACSNSAIYTDSSWHFLTGVYNHTTNKTYLYVDSVLQNDVGQANFPGNISNNENLAFGGHNDLTHLRFKGALDDIRIYKRMLSATEIAHLYKQPNPGSNGGVTLVKDTAVCTSSPVILNAGSSSSYTWSTGSTTQTISVNNSGAYWVQTLASNACKITDTIHLSITTPTTPNFLKDTSVCANISYTLSAAQANATSYTWSTGATGSYIIPSTGGTYWVNMHIGQCFVKDTAQINFLSLPAFNLVADTFMCADPILLSIKDTSLKANWSTGSHSNQTSINSVGVFSVSVTNKNGCVTTAIVTVRNTDITNNIIVPNVFTPNGDNINDVFEFNTNGFIVSEFNLYNRWGKLVYSTQNAPVNWDGKQVDDGTYFWTALFTSPCNNSSQTLKQKGFLTVLK